MSTVVDERLRRLRSELDDPRGSPHWGLIWNGRYGR